MQEPNALQQLDRDLEQAKKAIAFRDLILKLSENRDFKKVIREEFMVNAAAEYVRESADPMLTDRQQADALALAQAAGHLKRWMSVQIQLGNDAEYRLEGIESTIEEIRAEEDGGEAE